MGNLDVGPSIPFAGSFNRKTNGLYAASPIRQKAPTKDGQNSSPLLPRGEVHFSANTGTPGDTMPDALKAIKTRQIHKTVASAIAWFMTNPGPKGFPHSMMRQILPELERVQFDSTDFKASKPDEHFKLTGYWSPARNKDSKNCVMLVHGFGGGPRDLLTLAKKLNEQGYNIFMPELRAHGKWGNERPSTIGVLEGRDVVGALNYLDKAHPGQTKNLHLMGHSMGAVSLMTLPGVVSKKDREHVQKRVQTLILDSAFKDRPSAINSRAEMVYNHPVVRYLGLQNFAKGVCKAFIEQMNRQAFTEKFPGENPNVIPADIMTRYPDWSQKVKLVIHGGQDTETPFTDGQAIHATFKRAGVEHAFLRLPDADHVSKEHIVKRRYWPLKSKQVLRGSETTRNTYCDSVLQALKSNGRSGGSRHTVDNP